MKRLIGLIFKLAAAVLLCIVLLIGVVTYFRISLDLIRFKNPIEDLVSQAIGRPVSIEKSIIITTSLAPVFTLEGLRIGDDGKSSSTTFLYLDFALIQVELLPLIKKKVHVTEVIARRLELNLEEREDGSVNWILGGKQPGHASQPPGQPEPSVPRQTVEKKQLPDEMASDIIVMEKLLFEDIQATYRTPSSEEPSLFKISLCRGEMLPGKPLDIDIRGTLLKEPYELDLKVASLEELFIQNKSWMEIGIVIAETELSFGGNINLVEAHKSLALEMAISGDNLHSLNELLNVDLPPFEKYNVRGAFFLREDHLELKDLAVMTGVSRLSGAVKVSSESDHYDAEVDFYAPLVQINDFLFDDWSWTSDVSESELVENKKNTEGETEVVESTYTDDPVKSKPLDPELLALANIVVSIRADKVLSGEDYLGGGYLAASLQDGRIAIEPLELNIPGGSINVTSSLKPGKDSSDASLTIKISNFDIGILVRRTASGSDMGGLVNLDVDLSASASSLEQLTDTGSGHFDFSGQLTNMKAGIIDLWAVNLVSAIVSSTGEEPSQINCAVGRWSIEDGMLTPDMFLIDTSKIRICGTGSVDFRNQSLDLTVAPKAKKAEYFSLASPLSVSGKFNDIGLGIKGGGLVGAALRFIASPITTSVKRVILDKIPADGSDVCSMPLGTANRKDIDVQGCP